MTDKTFAEIHQERITEAAIAKWTRTGKRDRHIADLVQGKSRGFNYHVEQIVVMVDGDGATTGAFLAQTRNSDGDVLWYVVNDGKRQFNAFHTQAKAALHLIAIRWGDGDHSGTVAGYAGRVLGLTGDTE